MLWIYRMFGGMQIFTVIFLPALQNPNCIDVFLNIKDQLY